LTAAAEVDSGLMLLGTAHGALVAARGSANGYHHGARSAARPGRWVTKLLGLPLHRLALAAFDDGIVTVLS
jgi:hypothetical protein